MIQACDAGLRLAKKDEICNDDGSYELYNIQVENNEKNHLVLENDIIVESWDGKLISKYWKI
jgi:hypothetical protein